MMNNIHWNLVISIVPTIILLVFAGIWLITRDYVSQKEVVQIHSEATSSIKEISEQIKALFEFEKNWEKTEKEQLYRCR